MPGDTAIETGIEYSGSLNICKIIPEVFIECKGLLPKIPKKRNYSEKFSDCFTFLGQHIS
jgi:hypothetical protein